MFHIWTLGGLLPGEFYYNKAAALRIATEKTSYASRDLDVDVESLGGMFTPKKYEETFLARKINGPDLPPKWTSPDDHTIHMCRWMKLEEAKVRYNSKNYEVTWNLAKTRIEEHIANENR